MFIDKSDVTEITLKLIKNNFTNKLIVTKRLSYSTGSIIQETGLGKRKW